MNRAITSVFRAILALALFATFASVSAQQPEAPFTRTEAMIPMRDGVRLHTFSLHSDPEQREASDTVSQDAVRDRRYEPRHSSRVRYRN